MLVEVYNQKESHAGKSYEHTAPLSQHTPIPSRTTASADGMCDEAMCACAQFVVKWISHNL